jgi:hypothetical protein
MLQTRELLFSMPQVSGVSTQNCVCDCGLAFFYFCSHSVALDIRAPWIMTSLCIPALLESKDNGSCVINISRHIHHAM